MSGPPSDGSDDRGHTQFLDLTNGEGGELQMQTHGTLSNNSTLLGGSSGNNSTNERSSFDDEEDEATVTTAAVVLDPTTPGKVVESGREHTGRWTKLEHEAFLKALQTYGKEWKKVAAKVKTRTVVQTRTHAQKYFQKVQKSLETTGAVDGVVQVDMGTDVSVKPMLSTAQQKRPKASTKVNRRSSSTTISAAHAIQNLSQNSNHHSSVHRHGMSDSHAYGIGGAKIAPASAGSSNLHGFAQPQPTAASSYATPSAPTVSSSSSSTANTSNNANNYWPSHMKIHAPIMTTTPSKFPEPSPAATGKRKLAEIAAARMLAGVASDDAPTPPPVDKTASGLDLKRAPPPPLFGGGFDGSNKMGGSSLQIVNPSTLGVANGSHSRGQGGSPVTPWEGQLKALVTEQESAKMDVGEDEEEELAYIPSGGLHPVCGPGDAFGRSSLHRAICDMDLEKLRMELQDIPNQSEGVLHKVDEAGYCPLHTACALGMTNSAKAVTTAVEMVKLLLSAGVSDPARPDKMGNTPLHWAARAGDCHVADVLLCKNAPLDEKNHNGESPLHWAMRVGSRGAYVVTLLLEGGARPGVLSQQHRRPLDVAGEGFLDDERSIAALKVTLQLGKKQTKAVQKRLKETAAERRDTRTNLLIRSLPSRTLVLHHPECLEHHAKSETDWEAPDRVTTILRRIIPSSDATGDTETSGIFPHEVTVSQEFERARLDLLKRVHSTEYLSFVNELSRDLERQVKESEDQVMDESDNGVSGSAPVVPFTPLVQRSMIKVEESRVKLGVNSDTSFSAGSLRAARRAAGAVQHAVDCVLVGRNRNAFCVVRPPGHHAGISGLLDGGESCGFCIFNNVAAGALYAISDDRLLCDRCAIVDIDVHHGNGTEEIVRKCHDPSKLLFFSIHLYDNDRRKRGPNQASYKFYPGTGAEDDLAMNIINVPIVPLWKDQNPPAPAATRTHNTRRKGRSPEEEGNTTPKGGSTRSSDAGSEEGSTAASISSPKPKAGISSGREAYRTSIQNRLLPALRAFNPDLILISAGFDAAKGDVGNARHERGGEKVGLDLDPEDYAWTTRKILEVADLCCQGRVVSVLEGGYGRSATAPDSSASLDRTLFAECAVRHLHAMVDPYNTENRFS